MASVSLDSRTEFLLREYAFDYKKVSVEYIRALIDGAVKRAELLKVEPSEDYLRLLCGYMLSVGDDSDSSLIRSILKITDDSIVARWANSYEDPSGRKGSVKEFEKMFRPSLGTIRHIMYNPERVRIITDPAIIILAVAACSFVLFTCMTILESASFVSVSGMLFLIGVVLGGAAFVRGAYHYPGSFIKESRQIRYIGIGLILTALFILGSVMISLFVPESRYKGAFNVLMLVIPLTAIFLFSAYVTGFRHMLKCKLKIKGHLSKKMQYLSGTGSRSMWGNSFVYAVRYSYNGQSYDQKLGNLQNPVYTSKNHRDKEEVIIYIDPVDPELFTLHRFPNPIAITALLMAIGAVVLGILAFVYPQMA